MIFSVTTAVLELCCYLLGIIVGGYFFRIVDLTKIVRIKNNREFYTHSFIRLSCSLNENNTNVNVYIIKYLIFIVR